MTSRVRTALAEAVALALVLPPASAAAPRAMIYVAEVKAADEGAQKALQDWDTGFSNGLDSLIYSLGETNDPGHAKPQIVIQPYDRPGPSIDQLKVLYAHGDAVDVSSAISESTGAYSRITMTIYLGKELQGSLDSPLLVLHQKVLAGDYSVDHNALALVTLYAWAQQAMSRQPPGKRTAACGYLARARAIGLKAARDAPEVAPVLQATNKGLSDNQCPHA